MTNPGDYIFQPDYGAGLPQYVGQNQSKDTLDQIAGTCKGQMLLEACVAESPAPRVSIQQLPDFSLWVYIQYVDVPTGTPVVLSFNVEND
jgi:hypothetical protein